ncbi:MAG: sigma 54-interacting transcriptional regulator [Acidobacteriota bacterium]
MPVDQLSPDCLQAARRVQELSTRRWGGNRTTVIIGRHPRLERVLTKTVRFASAEGPALITGESGVGKELFARAFVVSSKRAHEAFLSVNCAQYSSDQLVRSELFGHCRGAFTGAVGDHRGLFREAEGGTLFLDEIGELSPPTQAMLLRVVSEGEVVPVGGTRPQRVNVRIVAATNRNLADLVAAGRFREDLYFRLKCLTIDVPSLRERGNDWELIARHYLSRLHERHARKKELTPEALATMGSYRWPGNVRELKNILEAGYHLSDSDEIEVHSLGLALEEHTRRAELGRLLTDFAIDLAEQIASGERSFWEAIHQPYLDRELNREQVRETIAHALLSYGKGSYKRMLTAFGVDEGQYLKVMDFLRHHDLKARV